MHERGIGAVLLQGPPGDQHIVSYISHKRVPGEVHHCKKEALAIKWLLGSLKYYLLGGEFTSETTVSMGEDEQHQWKNHLVVSNPFKFIVHHIPGKDNTLQSISYAHCTYISKQITDTTYCSFHRSFSIVGSGLH